MTLRRGTRAMLALLGAVAVFAGLAVATAPPAAAAVAVIGDCKEPPTPAKPMGNPLAPGHPYNASERDPFKKGSDVTIAQVYGNGYTWQTYDNGCGPGDGIMPSVGTGIANLGLEFSSTWVAWGRTFQTSVLTPDNWIGKVDPAVEKATKQVADGFWFPWLPVALLVVAIIAMFRSRDGQVAQVVTGLGWSFVVLILVSWVVSYPAEAPRVLDKGIATATTTIGNAFAGEKATDTKPDVTAADEKRIARGGEGKREDKGAAALAAMQQQWDEIDRQTSYRTWLVGTFGSATSETAKKYGPEIFKATHFTWKEADTYESDPTGKGKKIVERKQELFEETADKIKEKDPIAYDYLTGNRWMERITAAMTGALITAITVAFLFLAGIGMAAAYVVIRLIVPFAPAAGPIFLIDSFRDFVKDKGKRAAALLVMGPIYLITGLVVLRINTATLSSDLGLIWKIFIIALVGALAWKLTKPAAFGGHGLGIGRMMRQAAATAAGVRLGRGNNDDTKPDEEDTEAVEVGERGPQPYRRSYPKDRPVHESRELPAGSPREDSHDLGEIPNESQPVSAGVFVPREGRGGLPTRREALALPAGSSPGAPAHREAEQSWSGQGPSSSDMAEEGRVRPFATDPIAPEAPAELPPGEQPSRVEADASSADHERLVDTAADEEHPARRWPREGGELRRPQHATGDPTFTSLYGGAGTTARERLAEEPGADRDRLVDAVADENASSSQRPDTPSGRGHTTGLGDDPQATSAAGPRVPAEDPSAPPPDVPNDPGRPVDVDGQSAASGRVMESREEMPAEMHEANYTYDTQTGEPVFTVYRPESMRRGSDG